MGFDKEIKVIDKMLQSNISEHKRLILERKKEMLLKDKTILK